MSECGCDGLGDTAQVNTTNEKGGGGGGGGGVSTGNQASRSRFAKNTPKQDNARPDQQVRLSLGISVNCFTFI